MFHRPELRSEVIGSLMTFLATLLIPATDPVNSVCEEKVNTIFIPLLDVVIVEVIHLSLADIEDAHSTIDRLIEHQLSLLYVD